MGPLATIGFSIQGTSLVIGVKSIIDLYAKLIGVSSLLDEQQGPSQTSAAAVSENGPSSSALLQQAGTTTSRHSVGWYLSLGVICVVLFRVVTP